MYPRTNSAAYLSLVVAGKGLQKMIGPEHNGLNLRLQPFVARLNQRLRSRLYIDGGQHPFRHFIGHDL
jgi:hypothetical protein